MTRTESQQIMSSAAFISVAGFIGAIIGFFLQQVVAYHFGADVETDAFIMAQSVSELVGKLLMGGSITAVFLPFFVELIAHNKRDQAWHLGLNIMHLMAALFVILIVVLAIFTRPFVLFIARGFNPEQLELTVNLLRVLLPSFLILFLVDMVTAMLHSLKKFAMPALMRVIAPTISLISVITFVQAIGIFSLAVGVLIGSIIQLVLLFITLYRQGFRYHFVFALSHPAIKRTLYLVYPFIFSALMTAGAGIAFRILASELAIGSLSAYKYAEKITQLMTVMFLNSITQVIFPFLSEKASKADYSGIRETMGGAIRLIIFITLPLITGTVILSHQLIDLAYQHGKFSVDDATATTTALVFLAVGLAINGISSVLGHATLALQETRASVAVTIASQALAIALFVVLTPRLGLAGLALSAALVPLGISLLYFLYLTRFISKLGTIFVHPTYFKVAIITAVMGTGVYGALQLIQPHLTTNLLSEVMVVTIPTLVGIIIFLSGAYLWNIPEMHDVLAIIRQKKSKYL